MQSVSLTSCSVGLACFNSGRVNHLLAVSKCETLASPHHCTASFSNILAENVKLSFLSKLIRVKLFLTSFFPVCVQAEGEDSLKKMQLMELAILNGTYRDANVKSRKNDIIKHQPVFICAFSLFPLKYPSLYIKLISFQRFIWLLNTTHLF